MLPEVLRFYRETLRLTRLLKPAEREYYRHMLKNDLVSHSDATDPDRIRSLLENGRTSVLWVLKKSIPGFKQPPR